MKTLTTYINEKLVLNKDTFKNNYKYFPKTKIELYRILQDILVNSDWKSDNVIDLNNINTYEITDMSELFSSLNIKNIDISRWDVSNVENMVNMFFNCKYLELTGDLSKWNVSKVNDMSGMFAGCKKIKTVGDLSNWNVSNVEDMSYMFYKCENLKSTGYLSSWNVSKVKKTDLMFSMCGILDNIGDISNWDISNIIDAHGMFEQCKKLSKIGNLFKWKNKSNPNAVYDNMFIGSPNLIFLDRWWEK